MNRTHKLYGAEQRNVRDMPAMLNPAVFHSTLVGCPVLPESEVQYTAVTDLRHTKALDLFAELFSPLEDRKLRAPIGGHLASMLNYFYVWDHFRKATSQIEAELEQIKKAKSHIQTELEQVRNARQE